MSKYQFAESEIYLPGTDISRNRLGIEEPDLLHEVEATLLQQAYTRFITELDSSIRFDENYFKELWCEKEKLALVWLEETLPTLKRPLTSDAWLGVK